MSAYRKFQSLEPGKELRLRDIVRVYFLETVGPRIPLSLSGCHRILLEPGASDKAKARATKKIIELGEVDELSDLLPKAPFHMQKEVAEKLIWRIKREIALKEGSEAYTFEDNSLYKVKSAKEYEAEARTNLQTLLRQNGKNISLEAIEVINEFLSQ